MPELPDIVIYLEALDACIGGEIFDGLAGIDVDELEVPCDGDTGLGLSDVAADILALDV